jgi:hypothetical protein
MVRALARLAGLLADVSFAREWHVPTGKVITDWRQPVPPDVMESLFWQAAGSLIAGGDPSAVMLAGLPACAADGMLVNLADTPANRAFFGSTGTADDSSPFPQLRIVAVTARAGRAVLGAVLGQAGTGEQTLLKRLVKRRPDLFAGRVTCFDRNFPGHELVTAILDAGGHVIARAGGTLSLPMAPGGGWRPDGSRLTWLNAPSGKKADRLPVRAAEHNAVFPAGAGQEEVSETCTVITTLLDQGGNRPGRAGTRAVEPPPPPPRHAGQNHALTSTGNRYQDIYRTRWPIHARKAETPKLRGVGSWTRCHLRHRAFSAAISCNWSITHRKCPLRQSRIAAKRQVSGVSSRPECGHTVKQEQSPGPRELPEQIFRIS